MNHDRDRTHAVTSTETAADLDAAPGRASRTDGLNGPTGPRASGLLMRKAARDTHVAGDADAAVAAAASSTGSALPDDLRARFEGSLGTDLSSVRVHTGSTSHEAASAVGAKAYALGNDVHFGAGHYDPSSADGQHLLAHEVAHTVQQRGGSPARQNKLEVSSSGDHLEHEADRAASAMVTGAAFSLGSAPSTIQRSEGGPEVSGGLSVSAEAIKAQVKGQLTKKFKFGYVEIEGGGEFAVDATLSRKEKEAGEAGESDKLESHLGEACAHGSHELTSQVEAGIESKKSWLDAKIEAPEFEADNKGDGGVSVTLKLTIGGQAVPVKFTALELAKGKLEVLSVEVSVPITLGKTTLWENANAKLVGASTLTSKVKVQPNWGKIGSELLKEAGKRTAKKVGEKVLEDGAEALETGFTAISAASAVELIAFGSIAASTLLAFSKEVGRLADIKDMERQCDAAVAGFTAGAMTALGVPSQGGNAGYFALGQATYMSKLLEMTTRALKLPKSVEAGLEFGEIRDAILARVSAAAPAARGEITGAAKNVLGERFARQYDEAHKKDWFYSPSDAQGIAHHEQNNGGHDIDLGDKKSD